MGSLIAAAQLGDLEAQRAMRDAELEAARSGSAPATEALKRAIHWARLAAANGDKRDGGLFAATLLQAVSASAFDGLEAPALAVQALVQLDKLADEGDEACADALRQMAEYVPPEVIQAAAEQRKAVTGDAPPIVQTNVQPDPAAEHAAQLEHYYNHVIVNDLCIKIAERIGKDADAVWAAMTTDPTLTMDMLAGPFGHSIIAFQVAETLGVRPGDDTDYFPTIH